MSLFITNQIKATNNRGAFESSNSTSWSFSLISDSSSDKLDQTNKKQMNDIFLSESESFVSESDVELDAPDYLSPKPFSFLSSSTSSAIPSPVRPTPNQNIIDENTTPPEICAKMNSDFQKPSTITNFLEKKQIIPTKSSEKPKTVKANNFSSDDSLELELSSDNYSYTTSTTETTSSIQKPNKPIRSPPRKKFNYRAKQFKLTQAEHSSDDDEDEEEDVMNSSDRRFIADSSTASQSQIDSTTLYRLMDISQSYVPMKKRKEPRRVNLLNEYSPSQSEKESELENA